MSYEALSDHTSYNNRFRNSSTGIHDVPSPPATTTTTGAARVEMPSHNQPQPLRAELGQLDLFGHMPLPLTVSSSQQGQVPTGGAASADPHQGPSHAELSQPPPPMAPGKPRRMSRGSGAGDRRQQFAVSRYSVSSRGEETVSSECGSIDSKRIFTSQDSACDDVFVDVQRGGDALNLGSPGDGPFFPEFAGHARAQITSSNASILPNPYNNLNHRLHSVLWCCNCVNFVFLCCLPAIYCMEQSDVEYGKNNHKNARRKGAAASAFFFLGIFLTVALFALLFFLAIYFSVYYAPTTRTI